MLDHKKGVCELLKKVDNPWKLDAWESLFLDKVEPEKLMNTQEAPMRSCLFKFASVRGLL